jgi:hypothetical protein
LCGSRFLFKIEATNEERLVLKLGLKIMAIAALFIPLSAAAFVALALIGF